MQTKQMFILKVVKIHILQQKIWTLIKKIITENYFIKKTTIYRWLLWNYEHYRQIELEKCRYLSILNNGII